ncbi:trans-aconitate methyltransferase [Sphaerochaeta pleomorpha str. Grapes]|uniref:Trans-aconitate methyltransferase n=1 Tax=Sphaerochaeta pleomorpha (strain ATCC BAA-1885 / DSM 22778 / Grapes) TaxID=158190 RepID=G8QSR7_SPHPG|nr:class I SAM-dependent methyltransferase [Sphaerochaeta pleomorpha]AEV29028.1 trans-aconitate methyltransferase [Sphaerochaeta pleomorpha str. Grapes]
MNKQWNPNSYQEQCSFVYGYGKDLVTLLGPVRGKKIIDIGCGSAVLTDALSLAGALVTGIDGSNDMVAKAKSQFPHLDIRNLDALELNFTEEFDAAFSNAVFHWIEKSKQPVLLGNIARALKKGGILVAEMGGLGCAQAVHSALANAFAKRGLLYVHPHYFPSIGEYSALLEQAGLLVTYASLFDRPTKMEGTKGLRNWIDMFVTAPFATLSEEMQEQIRGEAEEALKEQLFDGQDWIIDYVRLRFRAEKR